MGEMISSESVTFTIAFFIASLLLVRQLSAKLSLTIPRHNLCV